MSSKNGHPGIYYTKPRIYPIIFSLWLFIMIIFEYFTIKNGIIPTLKNGHPIYAILIGFNQIFVAMFFYFGLTNLVFPLRYQYIKNDEKKQELKILKTKIKGHPKVQLLYTTYNDFMPYAFEECLHQTYSDTKGVILDNSTDPKVIQQIKQFVTVNPDVKWVRNPPNGHAKAGNLTEYLNSSEAGDYDYFVILDADELIEPQFVEKSIKFFQADSNLGSSRLTIFLVVTLTSLWTPFLKRLTHFGPSKTPFALLNLAGIQRLGITWSLII
ncbi:glycosyltransferase family 2 protein [Lactobacillaceae bacterium Scapto_B20]